MAIGGADLLQKVSYSALGFVQSGSLWGRVDVESGHWPLYRFDPRRAAEGLNPLQLDSKPPKIPLEEHFGEENRFRMLMKSQPERAASLLEQAQKVVTQRYESYARLAKPREEE